MVPIRKHQRAPWPRSHFSVFSVLSSFASYRIHSCPAPVTFRRSEECRPTQRSTRSSGSPTQSAPTFPRPTISHPDLVRLRATAAAIPYLHRFSPRSTPLGTPLSNTVASPLSPVLRLESGAPPHLNSLGASSLVLALVGSRIDQLTD